MGKKNETTATDTKWKRLEKHAWLVLLSFGFMYLFFYNGRQNINLVLTQMAQKLGSTTAAFGAVSSADQWPLRCVFRLQALYDRWRDRQRSAECADLFPKQHTGHRCAVGS